MTVRMDETLAAIIARLRPVFERHRLRRVILFGSLARGESTRRSDLDLIAVQETDKPFLDRYDRLLTEVVQAAPGYDVDLLIYTPQELADMSHRPFIAAALKEGVAVYESEQESTRS